MPGFPIDTTDPLFLQAARNRSVSGEEQEKESPGFSEVARAALQQENLMASFLQERTTGSDEGFNPYEQDLEGYEDVLDAFSDVRSQSDFELMKRRIDRERRNMQTLTDAGGFGLLAGLGASVLSPENLVFPLAFARARTVASLAKTANAIGKAKNLSKIAGGGSIRKRVFLSALEGSVAGGGAEAFLGASQAARPEEGVFFAGIAGGLIGGLTTSVGGLLPRKLSAAERLDFEKRLGYELQTGSPEEIIANEMTGLIDDIRSGNIPDGSIGAAKSKTFSDLEQTVMDRVTSRAPELSEVFGNSRLTKAVATVVRTPLTRTMFSNLRSTREAASALARTKIVTNADVIGEGTLSVEARVEGWDLTLGAARRDLKRLYKEYSRGFKGQAGDSPVSFADFRGSVGETFANGFKYEGGDPSIAQFAERGSRLFQELSARAEESLIDANLLKRNPDVGGTAAKHFRRFYDHDAIVRSRGTEGSFEDIVRRWFRENPDQVASDETIDELARTFEAELVSRDRGSPVELQDIVPIEGSTMERMLLIPDELLTPYLVRDIDEVFERFIGNVAPRIEMARSFKGNASRYSKDLYQRIDNLRKTFLEGDADELELNLLAQRINDMEMVRVFGASGRNDFRKFSAEVADAVTEREGIMRQLKSLKEKPDSSGDTVGRLEARLSVVENKLEGFRTESTQLQKRYNNEKTDNGPVFGQKIEGGIKLPLPSRSSDNFRQTVLEMFEDLEQRAFRTLLAEAREAESLVPLMRSIRNEEQSLGKLEGNNARSINKLAQRDIDDIKAMRNRLLGLAGVTADPSNKVTKAIDYLRSAAFISFSGGFTISSIPDLGKIVFDNGLRRSFNAFRAMSSSLEWEEIGKSQHLAGMIRAMEIDSPGRRSAAIWGLPDARGRGGVDEAFKKARDFTGKITLQDPWNGYMTGMAAILGEDNLIKLTRRVAKGENLSKSELNILRSFKLDDRLLKQLSGFTDEFGTSIKTMERLDLGAMRRAGGEARRFALDYEAAVAAHAHSSIPKPGIGTYPRFFDDGALGSILGMFRRFGFQASQEVLLVGLQRGDMAVANGVMAMTAAGGLVHLLKTALNAHSNGDRISDRINQELENPGKFMLDSIDRGGTMGILFDFNNISQRWLGVGAYSAVGARGPGRFEGRNLWSTLSPMAGYLEDVYVAGGSAARLEVDENTVGAARDLLPWQTLFYMRWLFDQIEQGGKDIVR